MVASLMDRTVCVGAYSFESTEFVSLQVSFEIADCLTMDFSPATYDVVYSRDTLLHIHNKKQVFQRLFQV